MSPIVLIAMPADHDRVRNVVGALTESDLDIYWERTGPESPRWKQATVRVLEARATVFFWSAAAQGPAGARYRALARRALAAGKAICVRLESAPIPPKLAGWTTYDLRGWRARASSLFMLDIVAGVKAKAAGLDPPLPRAPRQLLMRRIAIAVPSGVAAIALLVGLYRDVGIDRIASTREATDWARIRPGSCSDVRAFLAAHSEGVHAAEAQALLSSRTQRVETRWEATERPASLYISGMGETGAASRAAAERATFDRAVGEAERRCRFLADAASLRYVSGTPRNVRYMCEAADSGIVCDLHGEAACRIREPNEVIVETCGSR